MEALEPGTDNRAVGRFRGNFQATGAPTKAKNAVASSKANCAGIAGETTATREEPRTSGLAENRGVVGLIPTLAIHTYVNFLSVLRGREVTVPQSDPPSRSGRLLLPSPSSAPRRTRGGCAGGGGPAFLQPAARSPRAAPWLARRGPLPLRSNQVPLPAASRIASIWPRSAVALELDDSSVSVPKATAACRAGFEGASPSISSGWGVR